MDRKSLYEISDKITEEEYRNDGKMHYSTLSKFDRVGFHGLDTLFDKAESTSLTFGSVVDTLITGTEEEFNNRFFVGDFPSISDKISGVVKGLFEVYKYTCPTIYDIPDIAILASLDAVEYGKTWTDKLRCEKVRKPGAAYYELLYKSQDKELITQEVFETANRVVESLKTSPATSNMLAPNNTDFDGIERFYQLKFSDTIDGIDYSCMMDEAIVLHDKKIVIPVDLKTSSHYEDEFCKSFISWNYHMQARLYSVLLRNRMDKDDYFKDFKLLDYHFIVVNKITKLPLVWKYSDTFKRGTLYYGKNQQIECRDPFDVAKELKFYLDSPQAVPIGISIDSPNDLLTKLNEM